MRRESNSREDTYEAGRRLAESCSPGQVYALIGDLGAGKTVFAQGFAAGLGIEGVVNSPTFTILQVYEEGRLPLYHFDVYRIEEPEELYEIGFDEYLAGDGVCLVEWADLIPELLPEDTVYIRISRVDGQPGDYRRIEIDGNGE